MSEQNTASETKCVALGVIAKQSHSSFSVFSLYQPKEIVNGKIVKRNHLIKVVRH